MPVEASPQPLFSVVVLARDEEKTLPRLLFNLEDFREADGEVVLVDTGSTDDTVTIAKRRGCRVELANDRFETVLDAERAAEIEARFAKNREGPLVKAGQRLFHFGDARQHAASLASNRFVFQLDCSDALSAFDIAALNSWITANETDAFEYDQVYGNVRLRISRFYDRNRYRWDGRVHEVLIPTARADGSLSAKTRCDTTQLVVHHEQNNKIRNYLGGLAVQVLEHPEKPRWWHYLGRELFYHEFHHSAIELFDAHQKMETAWVTERSQSYCFMGQSLAALGRTEEAKESFRRGFEIDPTRREPLLQLATICSRKAEFESATHWARQALEIPRTSSYPEMEANYSWLPHALLYWSLFWTGKKTEAREHWEIYLSLAPEESVNRQHARLFPPVSTTSQMLSTSQQPTKTP